MPTFTMLSGPSGSGKSTHVASQASRDTPPIILSSDAVLEEWAVRDGISYQDAWKKYADDAASEVTSRAKQAFAAGADVIWDQTNLKLEERTLRLALVPAHYDKEILVFQADNQTLKDRAENRRRMTGKEIPDFVIDAQIAQYHLPTRGEGWDRILSIPKQADAVLLWSFCSTALGGFYQSQIVIMAKNLQEALDQIEPMIDGFIAQRVEDFYTPCLIGIRSDPDDEEFDEECRAFKNAVLDEARTKITPIMGNRMILYHSG
jgi:predicted kinase